MKTIKLMTAVLLAANMLLGAYAQAKTKSAPGKLQGAKNAPVMDSFCGFKAGENTNKAKTKPKEPLWPGEKTTYVARKSLRKFKEVELEYDEKDRLCRVSAYAWLKNTKLSVGLKELDACCRELGKFGFAFPADWTKDDEDSRSKSATDSHGTEIKAICGYQQDYASTLLEIHVEWNLFEILHNPPPVKIKAGAFSQKAGIARIAFVEKSFGVKFGQDISKFIKLDEFDEECLEELAKMGERIGDFGFVERKLASPFCGFDIVTFFLDSPSKKSLQEIVLSMDAFLAQSVEAAKAAHNKSLSAIEKWLGLDAFNTVENENVKEEDEIIGKNKVVKAGKAIVIDSDCESGGLKVRLRSVIHMPKGEDIVVTRSLEISPAAETKGDSKDN